MPIFYCISIVVRFKLLLDATIIKHRTTVNKCLTSANGVLVLNGRLTKRSTNEFMTKSSDVIGCLEGFLMQMTLPKGDNGNSKDKVR